MLNCTIYGQVYPIDDTEFNRPMPIVGCYIASATLLCAIAMLADLIHGIWNKQYWIPSKYFTLNAASLTVLGVAIKLSVDMTTPMPGHIDQAAKLGTSVFLLNVLIAFKPSVLKLEKNEFIANVVGLVIVVITSVVNISIQLGTGVIYLFKFDHIFTLCSIVLVLIDFWRCRALWRVKTKSRYETQHQKAMREFLGDNNREKVANEKLKEYLINFTVMAHSGCPLFVATRSNLFLLEVFAYLLTYSFLPIGLTPIFKDEYLGPISCNGESSYGLSVRGILISQIIAIVVAWVNRFVRDVYFLWARLKASRMKEIRSLERHNYWMHNLDRLQFDPFSSYIKNRHPMPIVLEKYLLFFLCSGFSLVNKVLAALSTALPKALLYLIPSISSNSDSNDHIASTSHPDPNFTKHKPYVLYREGEEKLIKMLMESALYLAHKNIDLGQKREPKHLVELLDNYMSRDFGGVVSFENDGVSSLIPEGSPPNCWALPVVTLASIAIALPNVDRNSIEKLVKGVKESIWYVNIVESEFGDRHELSNIKGAASIAWAGVDLFRWWLDVNLKELALQNRSPLAIIESLSRSAQEKFPKMMKSNVPKAVAADSMYRICQTLLREFQDDNNHDGLSERIFEKLCITISDILGACFTNLKRWILLECSRKPIEKRREAAYLILKFFGETEKILKIVERGEIPNLSLDQMGFIDEWHTFPRSV